MNGLWIDVEILRCNNWLVFRLLVDGRGLRQASGNVTCKSPQALGRAQSKVDFV
jgi:hypothetical protein